MTRSGFEKLPDITYVADCIDGWYKRKEYEELVVKLSPLLGIESSLEDSYATGAVVDSLLLLGREEHGLEVVNAALDRYPDDGSFLRQRATIHRRAGDREQALRDVETALSQSPDTASSHARKALLLEEMGRPDEALEAAREAYVLAYRNDFSWAVGNYKRLMDDRERACLSELARRLDDNQPRMGALVRKLEQALGMTSK